VTVCWMIFDMEGSLVMKQKYFIGNILAQG
jgi:hypothetical protein